MKRFFPTESAAMEFRAWRPRLWGLTIECDGKGRWYLRRKN